MGGGACGPICTFPKKRRWGSLAVWSNLCVQFWRRFERRDCQAEGKDLRTYLDLRMVWCNTVANETVRGP